MATVVLLMLALIPGQVIGLIPPRYDLAPSRCSNCRWGTSARPGSTRVQSTSYRVFNSAGPLPPYTFAVNSVGPKPSPGYHLSTNSAGPKPPKSYPSAANSAGPKLPPGYQATSNSVGPKLPPGYYVTSNRVGPKLPPGQVFSTNSAGPKPPVSSYSSGNSAGPKPPPGYHFTAGPKPSRFPALPVSPAPAPAESPVPVPVLAQAQAQAKTRAQAHAQAQARPAERARHSWDRREKAIEATSEKKSSSSLDDRLPCGSSCPAYRLLSRTARYEVRLYPATVWVSYVTATENRLLAEMEALAGIDDFLAGTNSRGVRLPRSYPMLTQLHYSPVHSSTEQEGDDFSISVPLLGDDAPPRPSTDQLVLDAVDQQRVYVMSFWARPWKLTDRALRMRTKRFSRRLRRHGQTFLDAYYYLAKYKEVDSEHRSYYEIWLYSTPHESTHRFRPMGKRLLERRTNFTIKTMRRLCRGRECPRFEVLSEFKGGIQKRHYYNAAFATSRLDRCESSLATIWQSLMPLHLYRQGINSHLERIEPTRPAGILRVWQDNSTANGTTCHMTVMVYLPRRLHRNPPNTGTDAPTIGLSYIHELTVYVQTAGDLDLGSGRLTDHVAAFHARLDRLGLCYRRGEYFVAVYDAVQRYHGRLNEIWTVAQRC